MYIDLTGDSDFTEEIHKTKNMGIIKLIGELFNVKFFRIPVLKSCFNHFIKHMNEKNIEFMCMLIKTVLDSLFKKMEDSIHYELIITLRDTMKDISNTTTLPPRVKFMIRDVLEKIEGGLENN
jgi:hypothetical protein